MKTRTLINCLFALFLLLIGVAALTAANTQNHPVIITIKDIEGRTVPNLEFVLLNPDKSVEENAVTDGDGVYKTKLPKGKNMTIHFNKLDQDISYNFKVPGDQRLNSYQLVCRLPMHLAPAADADPHREIVSGKKVDIFIILQNKDRKLLKNHSFEIYSSDSTLLKEAHTDGLGRFAAKFPEGKSFFILTQVYGKEYYDCFYIKPNAKVYTYRLILPFPSDIREPKGKDIVDAIAFGKERDKDFLPERDKYLRSYTLENVHFATGKWNLKPESFPSLNYLAADMIKNPKMKVEIAGHTDNVGKDKANMTLSQKRAESIVKYLVKKGIDESRMVPIGYGEDYPIATNKTAAGRAKNRRSECRILDE